MKKRGTTISLPAQRGDQLRILARHSGMSITDLLSEWIERGLEEAGITCAIPGVDITSLHGAVICDLDGFPIRFPDANDATAFADALEHCVTRGGAFAMFVAGVFVVITRHGNGVVVEIENMRRSFALTVAASIAKHLRAQVQLSRPTANAA